MYRYKSILVNLADDQRDDLVIAYAEMVALLAQSGRVQFLHVTPEVPPRADLYPDVLPFLHVTTSARHEALTAKVASRFVGPWHTAVHTDVADGAPLPELLRAAREGTFDLVIVRADAEPGLAAKLARKAPCSVLAVPPTVPARIERVVVPVDFSAHALDAADVAVAFAEAAGLDAVHFLHVYTVPTGYPSLRYPSLDLRATLRTRAVRRLETFIEALDLRGLTPELHLAESPDVPGTILSEAAALGADLMMVGTRGRSPSAAILLGSVAEQVLRAAPVPVVAVKRKGATTRLLDVLLEQHVARAEDRPMAAPSDLAHRLPAFERV